MLTCSLAVILSQTPSKPRLEGLWQCEKLDHARPVLISIWENGRYKINGKQHGWQTKSGEYAFDGFQNGKPSKFKLVGKNTLQEVGGKGFVLTRRMTTKLERDVVGKWKVSVGFSNKIWTTEFFNDGTYKYGEKTGRWWTWPDGKITIEKYEGQDDTSLWMTGNRMYAGPDGLTFTR